jgi:hypothetical protein
MEPVVNGLEEEYREQVEFRSLNANTDGKQAFQAYALPGHPGYVILNSGGEVLWRGFGEQSRENIAVEIKLLLTP